MVAAVAAHGSGRRQAIRIGQAIVRYGLSVGISFGAFLLIWQLWSQAYGVPALFPPPATTFKTLVSMIEDGTLFRDAAASMLRISIGFTIGSVIGVLVGLLIGTSRIVREVLDPYVNFLRFISGVAWVSIFIVWFGIGEVSKIALIVYTTVFTVLLNTVAGVAAISPTKIRAALCFGTNRRQLFFWVTLPATMRYIFTGMRLSMANSFLVIVAVEMVQADSGLGFMIIAARHFLAPDVIFAGMITIGILGLLSDRLLVFVTRTFFHRYYLLN